MHAIAAVLGLGLGFASVAGDLEGSKLAFVALNGLILLVAAFGCMIALKRLRGHEFRHRGRPLPKGSLADKVYIAWFAAGLPFIILISLRNLQSII